MYADLTHGTLMNRSLEMLAVIMLSEESLFLTCMNLNGRRGGLKFVGTMCELAVISVA